MNENENDENLTPAESEVVSQTVFELPARRRIHPGLIATACAAIVVIIGLTIWFSAFRQSGAGRPVPAPRSSTMEDSPSNELPPGQTISITAEEMKNSGIEIETIGEQMAAEVGLTAATGAVEANAYRTTPALALTGGIIRTVIPELGQNVSSGQTVAVISSNEFAEAQSRYVALLTETANAKQNYQRTQRLVSINQPGRTEIDAATKQVKAADAALAEMQNRYARTTRLAAIGAASREELEQDTTRVRTAEAESAEAVSRLDRANRLLPINPETMAQNEEALNKLRRSESELATARQRLLLYGMTPQRVNSLRAVSQVTSELSVSAPISGTVTSRSVNAGEVIETNKELLKITDLSTVWVIAQAFEKDLSRIKVGSGASVTSTAFADRLFRGQVTYIDPSIDIATRTARVRVEVSNPGGALKLGMYVNVSFGSLGQSERTVPVVPSGAVQNMQGGQIIFLATSEPNVFEIRPIRAGSEVNGRVPILEGANVGDKVVTTGSFMLRAERLKTHQ
jgi:cobalt-zinc-cadmium efflux system membrane fusion protein